MTSVDPPTALEFTDGFANQDGSRTKTPTTDGAGAARRAGRGHPDAPALRVRVPQHMEDLERWGAFDVFPVSVGQMDALLS